jgi:protein TonB
MAAEKAKREASHEAALFAYISGESKEGSEPPQEANPRRSKLMIVCALAVGCVLLVALPRSRRALGVVYRSALRAGVSWLNPKPAPVPPEVTQHESFGQEGDEYRFPVAANIPDATTDPSQIQVLPVVDPTAKPVKPSESSSPQLASAENGNPPTDQNQSQPGENGPLEAVESPIQGQTASPAAAAAGTTVASPGDVASPVQAQPSSAAPPTPAQSVPSQNPPPAQVSAPPHAVPIPSSSAIPSSLKSQIASMIPEASGAKPVEAAMSSIEPVNLPETTAWSLLTEKVDPVYPDAARAGGQRGSVVLQVLIGRDGGVQDAKFLQGSLVFARAAIDAVKQWRFKPFSLNGRAVSVQSSITLNFKPPA